MKSILFVIFVLTLSSIISVRPKIKDQSIVAQRMKDREVDRIKREELRNKLEKLEDIVEQFKKSKYMFEKDIKKNLRMIKVAITNYDFTNGILSNDNFDRLENNLKNTIEYLNNINDIKKVAPVEESKPANEEAQAPVEENKRNRNCK